MQKIYFVVVGKIKESFYREAVAEYVKRLSRFAKVEIKELPDGNYKVVQEIEEEAIRAVAKKAIERKTGARGLRAILEDVMLLV